MVLPEHHTAGGHKPRGRTCIGLFAAVAAALPILGLFSLSGIVWSRHIVSNAAEVVAGQRMTALSGLHSSSSSSSCQPVVKLIPPPKTRQDIALMLQHEGFEVGAELGVQHGVFAAETLWVWRSCKRYYLIDDYSEADQQQQQRQQPQQQQASSGQAALPQRPATQEEVMQQAHENLQTWQQKVVWMRNTTSTAARLMREPLDYVYIDRSRDYCGVLEDIQTWWPLVKPGGIMAGSSYENAVDVMRQSGQDWSRCQHSGAVHQGAVQAAVNEFFESQGLQIVVTYREQRFNSWLVRKPYYPCNADSQAAGLVATAQDQDEQLTQLLSTMLHKAPQSQQQQQLQPKSVGVQQQPPQQQVHGQQQLHGQQGSDTQPNARTDKATQAAGSAEQPHKERQQQQLSAALQKLHDSQGLAESRAQVTDEEGRSSSRGSGQSGDAGSSSQGGAEVFGDIFSASHHDDDAH